MIAIRTSIVSRVESGLPISEVLNVIPPTVEGGSELLKRVDVHLDEDDGLICADPLFSAFEHCELSAFHVDLEESEGAVETGEVVEPEIRDPLLV